MQHLGSRMNLKINFEELIKGVICLQVYLIPKFKEWVRSILLEGETDAAIASIKGQNHFDPPVNDAATAATAAAAAASEVASAMRELAHARVKGTVELLPSLSCFLHYCHHN